MPPTKGKIVRLPAVSAPLSESSRNPAFPDPIQGRIPLLNALALKSEFRSMGRRFGVMNNM